MENARVSLAWVCSDAFVEESGSVDALRLGPWFMDIQ